MKSNSLVTSQEYIFLYHHILPSTNNNNIQFFLRDPLNDFNNSFSGKFMCEESAVQSNIKHEKHISAYVITLRVVFVCCDEKEYIHDNQRGKKRVSGVNER